MKNAIARYKFADDKPAVSIVISYEDEAESPTLIALGPFPQSNGWRNAAIEISRENLIPAEQSGLGFPVIATEIHFSQVREKRPPVTIGDHSRPPFPSV
jgi:hypothetical protein